MSYCRGPVAGRTDVTVRRSNGDAPRSDADAQESDAEPRRSDAEAQRSDADARRSGAPEPSTRPESAGHSIAQRPSILDD